MTPVLIVGASGLVGSALMGELTQHHQVVGTYLRHALPAYVPLDLRNRQEVWSLVHKLQPKVVLCPAAEPNVELCETDPLATREINVLGLQNMIAAVADIGAFLVYFSSEYVFDGANGPYGEDDVCNPLNEYGRQKAECERMIADQLDSYIVGRVSGVYDWEPRRKNFVVRLIHSLKEGRAYKVPNDQIITPTFARNLAGVVRRLVEDRRCGIFHLSGALPLLRSDFAKLIAEIFDLDPDLIIPVPTAELKLHAPRPKAAGLKCDKVQALLDFGVAGPREGLGKMKDEVQQESGFLSSTTAAGRD